MKCPKCQAENRERAQLCEKCGGKLKVSCPVWRKRNPSDNGFCEGCGQALAAERQAHHPDYSKPRSYVPKFLADEILTARNSIEGERKDATVLFSHLSDYTALSEKLDPAEVKEITSRIFSKVTQVVCDREILPCLAGFIGREVKGDVAENLRHLDGEAMGRQTYVLSRRFFERLAQRPLVLVFEDLPRADESTIRLIAKFHLEETRRLLVPWAERRESHSADVS